MKLRVITSLSSATSNLSLEEISRNLLTVSEVASLCHLEVKTIYNWLAMKRLKRVKLGSRTFCWKPEIEQLLRNAMEGK